MLDAHHGLKKPMEVSKLHEPSKQCKLESHGSQAQPKQSCLRCWEDFWTALKAAGATIACRGCICSFLEAAGFLSSSCGGWSNLEAVLESSSERIAAVWDLALGPWPLVLRSPHLA